MGEQFDKEKLVISDEAKRDKYVVGWNIHDFGC